MSCGFKDSRTRGDRWREEPGRERAPTAGRKSGGHTSVDERPLLRLAVACAVSGEQSLPAFEAAHVRPLCQRWRPLALVEPGYKQGEAAALRRRPRAHRSKRAEGRGWSADYRCLYLHTSGEASARRGRDRSGSLLRVSSARTVRSHWRLSSPNEADAARPGRRDHAGEPVRRRALGPALAQSHRGGRPAAGEWVWR
jgi:hypothetical protein